MQRCFVFFFSSFYTHKHSGPQVQFMFWSR